MAATLTGEDLARLATAVPGPQSRALARRLALVESPNVTAIGDDGPVFWADAAGANVRDVDGNVYVDLTAGFGVATAGHANVKVAGAIADQAAHLPHALGDVHPAAIKVRLLECLAELAPGDLSVAILGSVGAEAVEAALKTAVLHTGRTGVLAFEHAYHGLTYGALATTSRPDFREPFRRQLFTGVRFAPFPVRTGSPDDRGREAGALAAVQRLLDTAEHSDWPIGAILVEPVQGRGGINLPTDNFLAGLRELCDGTRRILILDEVYTGFGRTGHWFACEHWNVVPDVICVGKAMTGSVPLSAAIGSPRVMASWPASTGEAIHTSTFLGNPVACAAALAQLEDIRDRDLVGRAARLGDVIRSRTASWQAHFDAIRDSRGLGLLQAVEFDAHVAARVASAAQREGVLVLSEGERGQVLAITPPAVITDEQLGFALDVLERAVAATA